MAEQWLVGVDMGATDTKIALLTQDGVILTKTKIPTEPKSNPTACWGNIIKAILELIKAQKADLRQVAAIGVGCPGPLNSQKGVIIEAPNLPGWKNVEVKKIIERELKIITAVNNDANAAAYGEFWRGAGRSASTLIMFTLGTGVGGGIILDGKLYKGIDDTAGELGHIIVQPGGKACGCGATGCLETLASVTAVRQMALDSVAQGIKTELSKFDENSIDGRLIYECAKNGDALSLKLLHNVGYWLGLASASLVNVLNPEMILISGGMSNAADIILPKLRETLDKNAFRTPAARVKTAVAELGEDAGMIGAAGLAKLDV
ncbi:MAG: glucokinase [Candidatus Sumerlaeia bacterium]